VKLTPVTDRLAKLGATVYEGHQASHVSGAKALVVSSAVDEQNPEVQEARRISIPVIPRGELLAELMRLKYGIAVAGSHGKTTTTSMTATILNYAGLDPTVVVGGRVGTMGGSNARVGHSDFLVVESDESDGSFLKLAPIIAVVTNVDREHLDHYADLDAIRAAFLEFVNKVPFSVAVIVCLDDPNHHLWHHRPSRHRSWRDYLRALCQRIPPAAPQRGPGMFPASHSRPAQCTECHGRDRGGDGA
jgi:UDP-N-acetylmuramate--alanine ligase